MYAPNYFAIDLLNSCLSGARFFLDHDRDRNPFVLVQQDTSTPQSMISDISFDNCFGTSIFNEANQGTLDHASQNPFCFPQRGRSEATAAGGSSAHLPTIKITYNKNNPEEERKQSS
jgi:hypothetical protein